MSEVLSRVMITIGGIGTIAAVTLIFVFLVAVVLPLFREAEVEAREPVVFGPDATRGLPELFVVDEYRVLAAVLDRDGVVRVRRLDTGELVHHFAAFGDGPGELPTAVARDAGSPRVAFGFADGSIRLGSFGFQAEFPEAEDVPDELRALGEGDLAVWAGGILQRTPEGKLRLQRFVLDVSDPIQTTGTSPIRLIDQTEAAARTVIAAAAEDGTLGYYVATERRNLLTGKTTYRLDGYSLPYEAHEEGAAPRHVLVFGTGDQVMLVWEDGRLARVDARDPGAPQLAEVLDLTAEPGETITAFGTMLGKATLVVGTSSGRVHGWFLVKPEDATTVDGARLVRAHELSGVGAPVTAVSPSPRGRVVSVGRADGDVELYYMTSQDLLAEASAGADAAVQALALAPKEDGVVALTAEGMARWDLDLRHPEAGLAAFFTPVWYEGYLEPDHTWQAEGATDDFEPKFGFLPLVYGTLKATFYSMLFGTPLALLAAIFTSEFLNRRLRTPIKSSIEMMASLPSVVLGFVAALIIAPVAQTVIPATLAVFATVPAALLLGAYLWQLLPQSLTIRSAGLPRLFCIALTIPIGILGALAIGPQVEALFFAGDVELWLDGQIGNGMGGWMLILLPLAALSTVLFFGSYLNPWLRRRSAAWSRTTCAWVDLGKFAVGGVASLVVALALSAALEVAGFDPRGSYVGTYVQRNALIVGFVMGFAIVPIIYTLAEDALSSVPEHLRQASLGAGATPWQTAMRVIVPTAMSGLFSAMMIGLGRAVGETMIVLMATGNTPVMDMNMFNGFRTLSANIAVELPEAVQNSTHYRALFLAALVLFAMTFVLNTLAESVRLRFRKKAVQL